MSELQQIDYIKERLESNNWYKEMIFQEIEKLSLEQWININTLSKQKFWIFFDQNNSKHLLEIYTHLYISKNGKSISDYLTLKWLDNSFENRKKIFQDLSKEPYKGTAIQNMELHRFLVHNYEINRILWWVEIISQVQTQLTSLQTEVRIERAPDIYQSQRQLTSQDIFDSIIKLEQDAKQKLPEELKTFLQNYNLEAETYLDSKNRKNQENNWWLANIMSHNYASQFIASLVYSWLPENLPIEQKIAISALVAGSGMYWKEALVDQNITMSDISIPIFIDLWDNNSLWITFPPDWKNLSVDFRFNNIEKLNTKASEYIGNMWISFNYINHWNDRKWSQNPIENVLQVSLWLKQIDLINVFQTIKNTSDNDKNISLLQEFSQKYWLNIPLEDIQKLGPIYALQTFAIVNKDLLWPQTLVQLWIEFQWGKILLPKDLNISDPSVFIRMSIGWRLWIQLHTDRLWKSTNDILLNDVFTQLNIWVSETTEIETTTWLSLLLWPIAKVGVKHEISRDENGTITSVIVEWWVISKELAIWLWFQNLDTSWQWSKLIFSVTATWWYGITYENVSKVFWDTQTSTSLFFSKVIPMLSTMDIQNPWVNVTSDGNTIWKLDSVLQTIITTPESRELAQEVKGLLKEISESVWIDIDSLASYIRNIQNLQTLQVFLNENKDFIKENKSKIRYLVFVWHRFSFEEYDKIAQVLILNPFHWTKKLDENIFQKQRHWYQNSETDFTSFQNQEVSSEDIQKSNNILQTYFEYFILPEDIKISLLEVINTLQTTWMEKLSETEKKWFIQFLLRTYQSWQLEYLRNKRINILNNTLFFPALSSDNDKKILNIEKSVLEDLWKWNFDYVQNNNIQRLWLDSQGKKQKYLSLIDWLNSQEKEIIQWLIFDIENIEFVSNTDPRLEKLNNNSWENIWINREYLPFSNENNTLYISENIWKWWYSFEKILDMFIQSKSRNIQKMDTLLTRFTSRKAQIVKLERNAGSKQFYEFRPSSDIIQNWNILSVSYDIFDHWNRKLETILVKIEKNTKEIFITIWNNIFWLEELIWKTEYEHIVLALTWMTWINNKWNIKTIGWIIEQMI